MFIRPLQFALIVAACGCSLAVSFAQVPETPLTVTYTYSGYPLPIPRDSTDAFVFVGAVVPRALTITNVKVSVQVDYPYVGDLNVYMFSPIGTRVKLLERNCGSLANIDTTFDDAAPSKFADFCPAEAGRGPYRGNEPLSNFIGQNSLGTWRLAVENNGSDDRFGFVVGWSVTITGTSQPTAVIAPDGVRNVAKPQVQNQPIAPMEYISVYGYNLGPQFAISTDLQFWPTWIDGTVVRINGQDAPMKFISFYRIDVQVPVELDLTKPAKLSVYRNGVMTNEVEVPVSATSPGVMTTNQLGTGQAEAINSDGSTNSADKPAIRGSAVTVFATGLGVTDPVFAAGQPAPAGTTPVPVNAVSARIGGVNATVKRAAVVPNRIGVYGVEIEVPTTVKGGTAEVILFSGDRASQNGVVIQVQ